MVPEPDILPCGCRLNYDIIEGERTMIVTACEAGASCEYVMFMLERSKVHGKRATVLDAS